MTKFNQLGNAASRNALSSLFQKQIHPTGDGEWGKLALLFIHDCLREKGKRKEGIENLLVQWCSESSAWVSLTFISEASKLSLSYGLIFVELPNCFVPQVIFTYPWRLRLWIMLNLTFSLGEIASVSFNLILVCSRNSFP